MSFVNETRAVAQPIALLDRQGRDVVVVVVKQTFLVSERGALAIAPDPSPVRVEDVFRNPEDPRSSLLFPSDAGLDKRGTDVVVVGDVIAPKPVSVMDVAVRVRSRLVELRVHGPRVYYDGLLGVSVGPAAPFERVPLTYENAYGGATDDLSLVELSNPSGVGVAKRASDLVGKRAPQVEHPERPHASASDRHPPMGFGAIAAHWSPRREYFGTCDERYRTSRMPLFPEDTDERFANVAHPCLQFEQRLSASDPIAVMGMSEAPYVLALPPFSMRVQARLDGPLRRNYPLSIDTVVLLPNERRLEISGRAIVPMGRGAEVLRSLTVSDDA